ncbi:hypothetical protein OY671_009634, partial [Metschnikowia pulcherrima]
DQHQGPVDPAAGEAGDETDDAAEQHRHQHGQSRDQAGGAGPRHQAAQHVAADLVGAQPVQRRRRGKAGPEIDAERVEGGPDDRDNSHDKHGADQQPAEHRVGA